MNTERASREAQLISVVQRLTVMRSKHFSVEIGMVFAFLIRDQIGSALIDDLAVAAADVRTAGDLDIRVLAHITETDRSARNAE